MTFIVVDASISLAWCFPDEQDPASMKVLDRIEAGEKALVPSFWLTEVLNALLLGEGRGRIGRAKTKSFLADMLRLEPVLDYASLEQIAGPIQAICRDQNLTPMTRCMLDLRFGPDSRLPHSMDRKRRPLRRWASNASEPSEPLNRRAALTPPAPPR